MVKLAADKKQGDNAAAKARADGPQFSKEQIAASEKYCNQRDLVDALLETGKKYTIAAVDNMIGKYRKGKVG